MIIAVDFDGTIVEHRFPEIGTPLPHSIQALKALKQAGYKLILWTCRNDEDEANNGRKALTEAVEFLKQQGVEFDAVNANIPGIGFNPIPKVYANVYIDDRSFDTHIDWIKIVTKLIKQEDLLKNWRAQ